MKRLVKYYLGEFFKKYIVLLLFFMMLFFIYDLFIVLEDIFLFRPKLGVICEYFLNILPEWIYWSIPMSLLLTTTLHNGAMLKYNEIVAIKSMGYNMMHLFIVVLMFSLILSCVTLFMGFDIMPNSKWMRRLIKDKKMKGYHRDQIKMLANFSCKVSKDTVLTFKQLDLNEKKVKDVIIEIYHEGKGLRKQVYSELAEISNTTWILHNAIEKEIREEHNIVQKEQRVMKLDLGIKAADLLPSEKLNFEMSAKELIRRLHNKYLAGENLPKLKTELYFRIFYPLLNPVIVLISLALSFARKYTGIYGFSASIAAMILLYFFIATTYALANNGIIPPLVGFATLNLLLTCITISFFIKKTKL